MRRLKRFSVAFIMLTLSTSATTLPACYGDFALTSAIYRWNGNIANRFVRSLAFFGLVVIPVYEVCALGDYLIFNTIEFWGGSNPISGRSVADAARPRRLADGSIELRRGATKYRIAAAGERRLAVSKDGRQVADALVTQEGGLLVSDHRRKEVRYVEPGTVNQLRARLADPPAAESEASGTP